MSDFEYKTISPRQGVTLAYRRLAAKTPGLPGVVYMHGYCSDMRSINVSFLEARCKERGQEFLCFDYSGHGLSGGKMEDGTIGGWLQDSLDLFDRLTDGPQIVIGTSLGGWLEILLALRRKERIAGLIGLAAAPDFTEDIYNQVFSDEQRRDFDKTGIIHLRPSCGMDHIMTRKLFDEARDHLLLHGKIELPFPVRLIHGKKDDHVPWQKTAKIMEQVVSPDIKVILVEDGIHSMARDEDLKLLDSVVAEVNRLHMQKSAGGLRPVPLRKAAS